MSGFPKMKKGYFRTTAFLTSITRNTAYVIFMRKLNRLMHNTSGMSLNLFKLEASELSPFPPRIPPPPAISAKAVSQLHLSPQFQVPVVLTITCSDNYSLRDSTSVSRREPELGRVNVALLSQTCSRKVTPARRYTTMSSSR
jgi:hypothetical protein